MCVDKSRSQIPWREAGQDLGRRLIDDVDAANRRIKEGVVGSPNEAGLPDFESLHWRYELCLWRMFWVWYVANSPTLTKTGANKLLLDAFHENCCASMIRVGLLHPDESAISKLERDADERFIVYKAAFEHVDDAPRTIPTRGIIFARYLSGMENPNPSLAAILAVFGSFIFEELAAAIQRIEARYEGNTRS